MVFSVFRLGEIFSTDFLKLMSEKAEEYKLSDRARFFCLFVYLSKSKVPIPVKLTIFDTVSEN